LVTISLWTICRVDDELAIFADSNALCGDSLRVLKGKMNDTTFLAALGTQCDCFARVTDFGSDVERHLFQFVFTFCSCGTRVQCHTSRNVTKFLLRNPFEEMFECTRQSVCPD
jgi:hypothetical protein